MNEKIDLRPQDHGNQNFGKTLAIERSYRLAASKIQEINTGRHKEQWNCRNPEAR